MNSKLHLRFWIQFLVSFSLVSSLFAVHIEANAQDLVSIKHQYDTSRKEYRADTDNIDAAWKYGLASIALGRAEQKDRYLRDALKLFKNLSKRLPESQPVRLMTYDAYAALVASGNKAYIDELHESFRSIGKDTRSSANPPSFLVLLSRINHPRNYGDNRLSEDERDSLYRDLLLAAIEERPTHIASRLFISDLYSELGYTYSALAVARGAMSLSESDNVDVLVTTANRYLEKMWLDGCPYSDRYSAQKAIDLGRRVLKLDYDNAQAHQILRDGYTYTGQSILAINEAKIAVGLSGSDVDRIVLAELYNKIEKWDSATAILEFIDDDLAADVEYQYLMAALWQGHFDRALTIIENQPVDYIYTYFHQGIAAEEIGQKDALVSASREGIDSVRPTGWEKHLARFLTDEIDYKELNRKIENDCQMVEAYFYQGYKFRQSGFDEKAVSFFQNALDLNIWGFYEHNMSKYFLSVSDELP